MIEFVFVKSSHSTFGGECVEVALNVPGTVAVRDSKRVEGPTIRLTPSAWAAFAGDLRRLGLRRLPAN